MKRQDKAVGGVNEGDREGEEDNEGGTTRRTSSTTSSVFPQRLERGSISERAIHGSGHRGESDDDLFPLPDSFRHVGAQRRFSAGVSKHGGRLPQRHSSRSEGRRRNRPSVMREDETLMDASALGRKAQLLTLLMNVDKKMSKASNHSRTSLGRISVNSSPAAMLRKRKKATDGDEEGEESIKQVDEDVQNDGEVVVMAAGDEDERGEILTRISVQSETSSILNEIEDDLAYVAQVADEAEQEDQFQIRYALPFHHSSAHAHETDDTFDEDDPKPLSTISVVRQPRRRTTRQILTEMTSACYEDYEDERTRGLFKLPSRQSSNPFDSTSQRSTQDSQRSVHNPQPPNTPPPEQLPTPPQNYRPKPIPKEQSTPSNSTLINDNILQDHAEDDDYSFSDDTTVDGDDEDRRWDRTDELLEGIIEQEFPDRDIPTAREIINVGKFRKNGALYKPGDWVEIRGPDMKWRLDMITRVVKQAPDDWDWNDVRNVGKLPQWKFFYHAGHERMLRATDLRSPQEGLMRLFGLRPWVWQQWAIVKLENKLRFQKGHQDDFMPKDVQKYAADLWEEWLEHESNADFRAVFYDTARIGDFGRSELVNHIMTPFRLIDQITEDRETWNFQNDPSLNVYTYLSILGTGHTIPWLVAVLQFAIPMLLLYAARDGSFFGILGVQAESDVAVAGMSLVIFILYLYRVVPDTWASFYNTMGLASTPYSRLLSLRYELWRQRDDTRGQKIGYKMDIYMNTLYAALLYMLNIYIINTLQRDLALEIVLNALAFEFIMRMDEEMCRSQWWDNEHRWITAGACALVMQTTIRIRWLNNPRLFAEKFDIPIKTLMDACDNDPNLLKSREQSVNDENNRRYMTKDEIIAWRCRKVAQRLKNKNALSEYEKQPSQFGLFLWRMYEAVGGGNAVDDRRDRRGIFTRLRNYRTWSRWERILFLSPVPNLDTLFEKVVDKDGGGEDHFRLRDGLEEIVPTRLAPFANYDPRTHDVPYVQLFVRHCIEVVSLHHLSQEIKRSWRDGHYFGLIWRTLDGVVQVGAYLVQLAFPVFVVVAIISASRNLIRAFANNWHKPLVDMG